MEKYFSSSNVFKFHVCYKSSSFQVFYTYTYMELKWWLRIFAYGIGYFFLGADLFQRYSLDENPFYQDDQEEEGEDVIVYGKVSIIKYIALLGVLPVILVSWMMQWVMMNILMMKMKQVLNVFNCKPALIKNFCIDNMQGESKLKWVGYIIVIKLTHVLLMYFKCYYRPANPSFRHRHLSSNQGPLLTNTTLTVLRFFGDFI